MMYLLWLTIPLTWFGAIGAMVVLKTILKQPLTIQAQITAEFLAATVFIVLTAAGAAASFKLMGVF